MYLRARERAVGACVRFGGVPWYRTAPGTCEARGGRGAHPRMTGLFARDAREILDLEGHALVAALAEASRLRELRHGRSVNLCSIVNARSGACDQDCGFCAQSARSKAQIEVYPLLAAEEIVAAARRAA